jgi:pimeloyl-ACP methyl ester carboxylesterase
MKRSMMAALVLALMAAFSALSVQAADDKIGLVLLHGKQGVPLGQSGLVSNKQPIGGRLVADLKDAGYLVATPEMCWSNRRNLDKPFEQCLNEIDDAIAGLKSRGATAIVVGGLSQGGNVAIAYGAMHSDILGVIAYAPADDPTSKARLPAVAAAIAKAQRLVAGGKGDERGRFDDVNTGPQGSFAMALDTTANIYLSFYGPDSKASIPDNTARLKVPILWVAGDSDPTQRRGKAFAFDEAPANPLNGYVTVSATHTETPNAGRQATLAWLKELSTAR